MAGGRAQREDEEPAPNPGDQRERLVDAIARAAGEQGYDKLAVEQIARYAGVPPAAFYEHFSSKEQGLMAAFDAFLERLLLEVSAVCEAEEEWPQKVRAALAAALSYLAEISNVARVFVIEATGASLAAAERQLATLESFAAMLSSGRLIYSRAAQLPAPTERALVGGIASIVSGHLLAEDPQALTDLKPALSELVLIPYLGQKEARRVALG